MYNTDCKHKNKKQTKCKGRIDGGGGIATAAMRILEIVEEDLDFFFFE
jgi:hypothetical protein